MPSRSAVVAYAAVMKPISAASDGGSAASAATNTLLLQSPSLTPHPSLQRLKSGNPYKPYPGLPQPAW